MEPTDEAPEYWKSGQEYEEYLDDQGIPVHAGYHLQDARECDVEYWDEAGVNAAVAQLEGQEGLNDIHVYEIPPGESSKPQKHLHEQLVYVLQGQGVTVIGPDGDETTFEWEANALFAIPRNTRYRHVNAHGDEPVRLIFETDLPLLFSLFGDEDFLYGVDFDFEDPDDPDFYSAEGTIYEGENIPAIWESNFVPDIHSYEDIQHWRERGAGGASIQFSHPATDVWSHISQFPVGTYKKAHRHHPGANIVILEGEGYSLMWSPDSEEEIRIDWQPGTVFTPPALWYHQHFNTGTEPARYLALHPPGIVFSGPEGVFDPVKPYNQIQYPDEDPAIREEFEETLRENGIDSKMPVEAYGDPDFDFQQNYEEMETETNR